MKNFDSRIFVFHISLDFYQERTLSFH